MTALLRRVLATRLRRVHTAPIRAIRAILAILAVGALAACPSGGGSRSYPPFPWPDDAIKRRVMTGLRSAEVLQLGTRHDRATSRAMVRKITRPTLANLDYAAYAGNSVLHQPRAPQGLRVAPGLAVVDRERLFGKVVLERTITTASAGTPLTVEELGSPMAFDPLVDFLTRRDADQASGLEDARAAVKAEAWGLPRRPGVFLQQIAALYLHRGAGGATELWVRIEFMPWARLFERMPDADGDGYPEIYGRLRADLAPPAVVERIVKEYRGRVLASREVHTWANELASYWYPSHNTDVDPLGPARTWPLPGTEAEVRAELAGQTIQDPTVVIKGKPHGKMIYNVFVIPGIAPLAARVSAGAGQGAGQGVALDGELKAVPVSPRLAAQKQQLAAELAVQGRGSYAAWAAQLAPLHGLIRGQLRQRPAELKALPGKDGFLFYRKSLEYVVGGDLQAQPAGKNPFATIVGFKDYLAGLGVDFLLVPVPTKSEVFPDKLRGTRLRPAALPVLNPHARKLFGELTAAGVEIVDLLPAYLAARAGRGAEPPGADDQPLYQPQDTHWTDRGLRLAAGLIAARIKRYAWYERLRVRAVPFSLRRVSFKRRGDLHSRMTEGEQRRYRPTPLVGHRVIDPRSGKPYDDDPASPIVILGDSFTGVYQLTYCENAGVSAHLAHQIQHPVDLVMSYGGGPNVRQKLLTRGEEDLRRKRLLIWIFAARDLYDYWEDWAPLRPRGAGT